MSYKIYNAWKIKTNNLYKFDSLYNEVCIKKTVDHIINNNNPGSKEIYFQEYGQDFIDIVNKFFEKESEQNLIYKYFVHFYLANKASRLSRQACNLDCGYSIYPDKTYSYIIGDFSRSIEFDKQDFPDWVVDYFYYNNSDKPEDISRQHWNYRFKKWTYLLNKNYNIYSECLNFTKLESKNLDIVIQKVFNLNTTSVFFCIMELIDFIEQFKKDVRFKI